MQARLRRMRTRFTFANVAAALALFIALGGGEPIAHAATSALTVAKKALNVGKKADKRSKQALATAQQALETPGTPGPQGASGANGNDGAPGAAGAKGDAGPTGAQGLQGPRGDTGPSGANGTNGTNGANGADGAPGQGFTWRGAWEESGEYANYDVVFHAGSAWIADHPKQPEGEPSSEGESWDLLAAKGEDVNLDQFYTRDEADGTFLTPGVATAAFLGKGDKAADADLLDGLEAQDFVQSFAFPAATGEEALTPARAPRRTYTAGVDIERLPASTTVTRTVMTLPDLGTLRMRCRSSADQLHEVVLFFDHGGSVWDYPSSAWDRYLTIATVGGSQYIYTSQQALGFSYPINGAVFPWPMADGTPAITAYPIRMHARRRFNVGGTVRTAEADLEVDIISFKDTNTSAAAPRGCSVRAEAVTRS